MPHKKSRKSPREKKDKKQSSLKDYLDTPTNCSQKETRADIKKNVHHPVLQSQSRKK